MEIAKQIEQISIARETIKNIIKMTHKIIKSIAALMMGTMLPRPRGCSRYLVASDL